MEEKYKDLPVEITDESFRDSIATVDHSGKRKWIYPKQPKGKFYNYRTIVSYLFLAVFFVGPFLRLNGEPFLLLNILERKFILFGVVFMPQDSFILGLSMLAGVLAIALFTVIFGRLFCGWICPQTVFMEMVFRKIEYLIEGDYNQQKKLNAQAWTTEKIWKKSLKTALFFLIAVLVTNTFLSYLISSDQVYQIITEPISQHVAGFAAMIVFSFVFYFVFAWMREQVCIAICPYGRMQSVLLDKDSVVIAYDFVRGEPRGKIKKTNPLDDITNAVKQGDCIDCKLCIAVCPTGIDIRNGTQLECVNCTACIDVCDEVMEKVDKPKGLIRYASYESITTGKKFALTTRAKAYIGVLVLLVSFIGFMMFTRGHIETTILRTPGSMFQKVDENHYTNMYNYKVANKSTDTLSVNFRVSSAGATLQIVGTSQNIVVPPQQVAQGSMIVTMESKAMGNQSTPIRFEVLEKGKVVEKVKSNFLGPFK